MFKRRKNKTLWSDSVNGFRVTQILRDGFNWYEVGGISNTWCLRVREDSLRYSLISDLVATGSKEALSGLFALWYISTNISPDEEFLNEWGELYDRYVQRQIYSSPEISEEENNKIIDEMIAAHELAAITSDIE